jgi:hypothetical protein
MELFDCLTDTGESHAVYARSGEEAAYRVADLHQCTVVAVRPSRRAVIRVGIPTEA